MARAVAITEATPASSSRATWARVEQPFRKTSCSPCRMAEERRQPGRVRGGTARGARFQQEPAAVGMAGVMEDRDLVAVAGEDVEDLVEGRVGKQFQPAEPVALGLFEDLLKPPKLLGQVPQITPALLLVGEGQDDDRQLGHY